MLISLQVIVRQVFVGKLDALVRNISINYIQKFIVRVIKKDAKINYHKIGNNFTF